MVFALLFDSPDPGARRRTAGDGIRDASYPTRRDMDAPVLRNAERRIAIARAIQLRTNTPEGDAMRAPTILQLTAAALLCVSCGGSGGYGGSSASSTPTAPSAPATSNVVTITITGIRGALSFSPNPATCATGQTVVWKNADTVPHRVIIDELGINTGDIAPGASSQPMPLADVSKGYHCSIHPEMVGALNGAATPGPPNGEPCGPYGC